jgi:tRNA threonylcarbamoyladenosine biosynthesis protein TsaB
MITVGFDTATPATAVALLRGEEAIEARHDPAPGERPGHAAQLLALIAEVMKRGAVGWSDVQRLAVGVGPGSFTGLRIGLSTARSLAQARELPLAGTSSLAALAAPVKADRVAAVIDARRGEVFAAIWEGGRQTLAPVAIPPAELAARWPQSTVAVGDGAVRFRQELEAAGAIIPADDSELHRPSAVWICRLGDWTDSTPVLPSYLREPDAKPRASGPT